MRALKTGLFALLVLSLSPVPSYCSDFPPVLSIRDRAQIVNRITKERLDELLPGIMRETGVHMWLIISNEDNYDPVFKTMIPYDSWCPITQILVFYDRGPGKGVERLSVSRTNMNGLHEDKVWDAQAWDLEKKESQWDCLARVIRERNPKQIGVNESDAIWAADGLTVSLKNKLVDTIGPEYAKRIVSAEKLSTLWLETLLDEEIDLQEAATAISHAIIRETFSNKVITPGVTTTDDLRYYYWQRARYLGFQRAFLPFFSIRGRDPEVAEKFGPDDKVIRRGDLVHCDVGIIYMRYNTDTQEWAYILRRGESEVPETFQEMMSEANRLQDIFRGEFKTGLTGNQILGNILTKAKAEGIPNPRVYSHSLGYYLHEPGPLVGLPWEQVDTGARGEVELVPNSIFTVELSVTMPVPEWGGKDFRLGLEQAIAFTGDGAHYQDGRQTEFHVVR